jgi:uncharacterized phage infection (PIP) family protein YhgE
MAAITQTLPIYSGTIPNRATMSQGDLDIASTAFHTYWANAAPDVNAFSLQANALRTELIEVQADTEAARDLTYTYRDQTQTYRDGANLYATAASQAQTAAQTAQANAEQAETAAAGYASLAQATNPDTPIRVNPNAISEDFTLAANYNGVSAGPIQINDGVTVTVTPGSTWTIT